MNARSTARAMLLVYIYIYIVFWNNNNSKPCYLIKKILLLCSMGSLLGLNSIYFDQVAAFGIIPRNVYIDMLWL